jgi:DNA-directed RNA polymerase subunit alpha
LVIATITDNAGSMSMEITIGKGRGYRPVEGLEKKNTEVGYIETDAFFSPVLSVGLKVENVRVGKITNWDKLIIDIVTDGTVTPEEAFNNSVKVLQEQINALAPAALEAVEEVVEEEENDEDIADDDGEEVVDEKKIKKDKKAKKEKKVK